MTRYIELDALVAEIKRRKKELIELSNEFANQWACASLDNILSFLDTLEVKEVGNVWHDVSEEPKPNMELICVGQYGNPLVLSSNSNSFKERYISKWAYFNDMLNLSNVQRTVNNCKEEPVSEDLEEAAIDSCSGHKGADARVRAGFIEGAKWKEMQFEKKKNNKRKYIMKEIGVYKYNIWTKELIKEIIDFANNNKNNVFVNYYISKDNDNRCFLFNIDRITIYLYYLDKNLRDNIEKNEILGHNWRDVDMYDYDIEFVEKLKKSNETTIKLLNDILLMNKSFNKLLNMHE